MTRKNINLILDTGWDSCGRCGNDGGGNENRRGHNCRSQNVGGDCNNNNSRNRSWLNNGRGNEKGHNRGNQCSNFSCGGKSDSNHNLKDEKTSDGDERVG